jgi:hypothetical protein
MFSARYHLNAVISENPVRKKDVIFEGYDETGSSGGGGKLG